MTARCAARDRDRVRAERAALDHDHYQYKLAWLDRLGAHLDAVLRRRS